LSYIYNKIQICIDVKNAIKTLKKEKRI